MAQQRSPTWSVTDPDTDLADPHFYASGPHTEAWRLARRVHPVAWTESATAGGFWSVTGHREGNRVLKDSRNFISAAGMRLGADPAGVAAAADRMLVVSDGAAHRRLRAAHASWFTPRAIEALCSDVVARVDQALVALLERGEPFDAVAELTVKLPAWVLFRMLGVPAEDWDGLAALAAAAFDDAQAGPAAAAARLEAHTGILGRFVQLVDLRRDEPGDDLVSSLAQAVVDGRALTDDEVILNCDGLVNGGLETTPHAASGALLAFARHPEQWRRLKADPGLLERAVEEILRWTSPPTHAMRTAAADVTVGRALVRRGERIVVWIPSCNRDEEVFPEADRFLIDRNPNQHLSFGGGPHYCIGSALARLELRCFLTALLDRVESIAVVGEIARQASNFLYGHSRLDVVLAPAPAGPRGGSGSGT